MKINESIKKFGKENNVPISLDDTLSFLIDKINQTNSKKILEIGTAIGFSSIAMAENTNCEHITTLEIDADRYKIACENIKNAGLLDKIEAINIDAINYLKTCKQKFDLIYLDGPKNQYINYLPYILKILKKGGLLITDNLYFHGMVLGKTPVTHGCRTMIRSLHAFIAEITTNPKLETIIYEIGDGVGVTLLK